MPPKESIPQKNPSFVDRVPGPKVGQEKGTDTPTKTRGLLPPPEIAGDDSVGASASKAQVDAKAGTTKGGTPKGSAGTPKVATGTLSTSRGSSGNLKGAGTLKGSSGSLRASGTPKGTSGAPVSPSGKGSQAITPKSKGATSPLDKLKAQTAGKAAPKASSPAKRVVLTPRTKKRNELERELRKQKEEAERKERELKEAEEAEVAAYEAKRLQFRQALADAAKQKARQDEQMRAEREIVRGKENERKRIQKTDREMGQSWNYKMRLHYAALRGDEKLADKLLEQDTEETFNPNKTDPNTRWNEDGAAPLHMAALSGQVSMVQKLIERDAIIDLRDNEGRTPLLAAAERGECGTMELLLRSGANIDAPDRRGRTPLHVAVIGSHVPAIRLLIRQGAKTYAVCSTQGHTLLHLAVQAQPTSGRLDVLFVLLGGPDFPLEQDVPPDTRRLEVGKVWARHVHHHVSESTQVGLAMERLKSVYPEAWWYDNDAKLLDKCMSLCPGIPLPPFWCDVGQQNVMGFTPLDISTKGTAMHRALQAAVLLENERAERAIEDEEKATGKLRPLPTGQKQTARIRSRKIAIVIGNAVGPGGARAGRCEDDAKDVARNLTELGFHVTLLINASKADMMDAIVHSSVNSQESDLQLFYFSGSARSVKGRNFLIPSGGKTDCFSTQEDIEAGGLNLKDEVIKPLQARDGVLTMVFLDVFGCSPSIHAPAGADKWREGVSWGNRFPKEFLVHIRPPGTPASVVLQPTRPMNPPRMDGLTDGLKGVCWPLLAGETVQEEEGYDELLAEDGSLCVVFSHHPGSRLLEDPWSRLSPFTTHLILNMWNEGGGNNGAGGAYVMMLSDIKSAVMKATNGQQQPWVYLSKDADSQFCFVPVRRPTRLVTAGSSSSLGTADLEPVVEESSMMMTISEVGGAVAVARTPSRNAVAATLNAKPDPHNTMGAARARSIPARPGGIPAKEV